MNKFVGFVQFVEPPITQESLVEFALVICPRDTKCLEEILAESSRNRLLSKSAKKEAALIYSCLHYCKNNKKKGITELKYYIQNQFEQHKNLKLEYAEIIALNTMRPIEDWQRKNENAEIFKFINS